MVTYFQQLFTKKKEILIEARLLLFIQAYAGFIFTGPEYTNELSLMFEYIFVSIEVNQKIAMSEVIVIQAINCLLNIFERRSVGKRFSSELNKIIRYLKNITMHINQPRFFDTFNIIVTKHKKYLSDDTLIALVTGEFKIYLKRFFF